MQRVMIAMLGVLCTLATALATPPAALKVEIDKRIATLTPSGATVGVFIQSLEDGGVWYDRNATKTFIPASNTKIVTAVMALEYLKPEYRYTTRIFTNGTRNGDQLDGDLYLQGSGDPSLTPADLQAMAQLLAAGDAERGIPPLRRVTGKLILDNTFFPGGTPLLGRGWEKDDLLWYYAAPSNALSCNRNAVKFIVRGSTPGQRATWTQNPPSCLYTVQNRTITSSKVKTGAIDIYRSGNTIRITGTVAPGAELNESISMTDPAQFTAEQFRRALAQYGVTVGQVEFGKADPQQMRVLVEHNSAPLSELIVTMMKESDNHYAEQFYWTLLALYSLEKPLDQRYMAMLEDFMNHSGMLLWGMEIVDGSGLSRMNRMSPAAATRLLAYMASSPNFDVFYQSLPIAAEDGTLKKRMGGTVAAGTVRAKTGTMRSVCSLSGYVRTADGQRLAFSIMLNGYKSGADTARKLQDDIVQYLAGVNAQSSPADR